MKLDGRRESDNVEDVRGQSGGGGLGGSPFGRGGGFRIPMGGGGRRAGGGLGIGGIVVLLLICWALGINPLTLLNGGGGSMPSFDDTSTQTGQSAPANDEMKVFMSQVLAETEDTWKGIFQSQGMQYQDPKLVLFTQGVRSACGQASSATGPFYCPNDQRIYLDTNFFTELSQKFGASGDFAQAYVLAHEVGHHVQNQLGILPKVNQMRQSLSERENNAMSVRVELQADCFAGIWGKFTDQKGLLDTGDVDEALNAASQIGDDTLQRRTQGYVVPDSFNHGTSAQRATWFKRGFDSGKLADCDTFNKPV
ncbi:zinc metallopeptidase [Rhizobium sp. CFBP 8762]|uniref:KPN_02809 family neutral zinc metallopeptidase n=1 Tax=Rhizobium sp. CFBP 8762 TaxID=2775279 RepID=UPI00177CD358|nr:neutral zinc metallopeptidase [Rhizobium sp. CFBP 8762]MBD8554943.1 zinc metallopeptidase [Rhizobium sp. CFBP 8762]